MPAVSSSAPGKIILFGEHAVVYGYPAIAAPLPQVRAKAFVLANPKGSPDQIQLEAPDIQLSTSTDLLDSSHPFIKLLNLIKAEMQLSALPSFSLTIKSSIPVAAGLGSGAAVTVACLRAISIFLGNPLSKEDTSRLTFEIEKIYHGTPSGIDNTVITYEQPVFYQRGQPIQFIEVQAPLTYLIADSGIKSETARAVGEVRERFNRQPDEYREFFSSISKISEEALHCLKKGAVSELGPLMTENHRLLRRIGVSCPILDKLVETATACGALGAKLSGAGMGGNIIALINPIDSEAISNSLIQAGAVRILSATIGG